MNLRAAFDSVAANKGAPGPDGQSIEQVRKHLDEVVQQVRTALEAGSYMPGDIKRVWIPKAGGGQRGLGIPNVADRMVQQAVKMVLEPLYEPTFHASSHGFPPSGAVTHQSRKPRAIWTKGSSGGSSLIYYLWVLLAEPACGILLVCAGTDMSSGAELMIAEPWFSVEDVAKHLGVARDSVYRRIDGRGLPAHKIGRHWKFKLSEVEEWVRAGGADAHDAPKTGGDR